MVYLVLVWPVTRTRNNTRAKQAKYTKQNTRADAFMHIPYRAYCKHPDQYCDTNKDMADIHYI